MAESTGLALEVIPTHGSGGMPPVTEDTGTFTGNARKKAWALRTQLGRGAWILADDSGLCVNALDGAPGVESAYYAGPEGDSAANLRKLVGVMRDVPPDRRQAYFACVLVLIDSEGAEHEFEGRCEGTLRQAPSGVGGFGYDPLFVPDGQPLTFAELPAETKNALSHRARAWARLATWLRARLDWRRI